LVSLLEELTRPYSSLDAHPPHILLSELYILTLTADCCSAHWDSIRLANGGQDGQTQASLPEPLDDVLVGRIFEILKLLVDPIPDGYILPSQTLLDDNAARNIPIARLGEPRVMGLQVAASPDSVVATEPVETNAAVADLEDHVKTIVEYVTASSWPYSFDYFRNAIYSVRNAVVPTGTAQPITASDEERAALIVLRLLSFFWLDSQRLGPVIQEICSSFLHFRKSFQNTVAVVTPLLITRWLDRYPDEFVQLHTLRKRLDGGADTLFDMAQTIIDNGRRKAILYPLQTTLLFLLPDVFEVASNLREAKSTSMAKKVAFLDGLRKAIKNRNEQAGYCLVSLLRAARHFHAESDAALVSYAMDVQDEVRDAVFRRFPAAVDAPPFEQDMMTAAFVSLAHLNLNGCVDNLGSTWLAPSAPHGFKIAVVQSCCYFARQPSPQRYQALFTAATPFMRSQLEVGAQAAIIVDQEGLSRI
jgi:neurofibromin 1